MDKILTDPAVVALRASEEEAISLCSPSQSATHLLLGVLRRKGDFGSFVLIQLNVDVAELQSRLRDTARHGHAEPRSGATPPHSASFEAAIRYADEEADTIGATYIGTEHLFLGAIRAADPPMAAVLREFGITLDTSRARLDELMLTPQKAVLPCEICGQPATAHEVEVVRGWTSKTTMAARHLCEKCAAKK